jgi:hypothetical protein
MKFAAISIRIAGETVLAYLAAFASSLIINSPRATE